MGSITTRVSCGDFLLMVHTCKQSLFGGLNTDIGIIPHEKATIFEATLFARIQWASKVPKAGRQQLHGSLAADLSEQGERHNIKEIGRVGMMVSDFIILLEKEGLVERWVNSIPFERA